MKPLLTLSILAALSPCLQADEDKTLIPGTPTHPGAQLPEGIKIVQRPIKEEYSVEDVIHDVDSIRDDPNRAIGNIATVGPVLREHERSVFRDMLRKQIGWKALTKEDFTKVNSADDTWTWRDDGVLACTGQPVSVMRTVKEYKNFEMVVEWNHLKAAGNSGVFVWTTPESIERLTEAGKPGLPKGIEVQVLDNGYTDMVAKKGGKTDWFTTHGDVFPVGVKMTPIGKTSPDGSRSFPRQDRCKDHGNWNHYYIRAINGEVRLWVNGQEVSGGTNIEPAQGYLCLESEGSPIVFRNLRIRELP